jgi:hypothetical protein
MDSLLAATGTVKLLDLIDLHIPDDFINGHWHWRPARGQRPKFSAAQLFRLHLLALLTPVHRFNLLLASLPEQRQSRAFAHLPNQRHLPDVRMVHEFRARMAYCSSPLSVGALRPTPAKAACWCPGCTTARNVGRPAIIVADMGYLAAPAKQLCGEQMFLNRPRLTWSVSLLADAVVVLRALALLRAPRRRELLAELLPRQIELELGQEDVAN